MCRFTTSLEIICGTCYTNREQDREEISYLKKINSLTVNIKQENDILHALKLKRNNKVRVVDKKILPSRNVRKINAVRYKKLSVRERLKNWVKGYIADYEINLQTMLTESYCGTSGVAIAKTTSFIWIPGDKSWKRSFSNHSPKR